MSVGAEERFIRAVGRLELIALEATCGLGFKRVRPFARRRSDEGSYDPYNESQVPEPVIPWLLFADTAWRLRG